MLEGTWEDGICRACGSIVEETGANDGIYDYMNRCTNEACVFFTDGSASTKTEII